jgi:formylglycine-generating enzyme required for sulfatase activity
MTFKSQPKFGLGFTMRRNFVKQNRYRISMLLAVLLAIAVWVLFRTCHKHRSEMVLVPAGYFTMGSNDAEDEKPPHRVWVDAFYIEKYELTNQQYGEFMKATGHRPPVYWDQPRFNAPDQPVVGVSWDDAMAYCTWVGRRLPTEAEWEKAARGGLEGKKYPWGDEEPTGRAIYGLDLSVGKPTPVGRCQPNNYGLYDMAGNAWEWCADWYNPYYYKTSPERNPQGSSNGLYRVVRGGVWFRIENDLRCASRYWF